MAYCPKCGVEVRDHFDQCPLCEFPIPDIREDGQVQIFDYKYPEASNIYNAYRERIKNRIYFVMVVILINAMMVLAGVKLIYNVQDVIVQYIFVSIMTVFILAIFTYGFFGWTVNITGIALAMLFLTYFIAGIGQQKWFLSYALPIVMVVYVNCIAFRYMFKHSRRRQRLTYIPVFVLMICSSLCIGIDGVINYNLGGYVKLTWSLIVALSCMSIALVLHSILSYLPEETKEKLGRKFHM